MEASPRPEDFVGRSESAVCLSGYPLPKAKLGEIMESPFLKHLISARCLCISSHPHSNPLDWVASPVLKDCLQGHRAAGHGAAVHTQVRLTRAHVIYPKPHTSVISRDFLGVFYIPTLVRFHLRKNK